MRFLHTADWQMGMRAAHVGEAGKRVRDERLAAARRVVQLARERDVEFMIVAGDVFEDNAVDRTLVQQTGDVLAGFRGRVFLLPGNHDPYVPGSVWEHPVWRSHPNLDVLHKAATPIRIEGGWLYPCPLYEKSSDRDPTAWIPPRNGESGFRIGVAHGSVVGLPGLESDFPIAREAADRGGLDYLALGHWHSFGTIPDAAGVGRTVYSGTHEATKFGEERPGLCAIVELGEPGAPPRVETAATGGLSWVQLPAEIAGPGDLAGVVERIATIARPDSTLLDVRLAGVLPSGEEDGIARIKEILDSRFLYGRLDASGLLPAPDDAGWMETLPAGPVRAAAERLRTLAAGAAGGPDGERAAAALLLLYRLGKEARR